MWKAFHAHLCLNNQGQPAQPHLPPLTPCPAPRHAGVSRELRGSVAQLLSTASAASPLHATARSKRWPSIRAGLEGLGLGAEAIGRCRQLVLQGAGEAEVALFRCGAALCALRHGRHQALPCFGLGPASSASSQQGPPSMFPRPQALTHHPPVPLAGCAPTCPRAPARRQRRQRAPVAGTAATRWPAWTRSRRCCRTWAPGACRPARWWWTLSCPLTLTTSRGRSSSSTRSRRPTARPRWWRWADGARAGQGSEGS